MNYSMRSRGFDGMPSSGSPGASVSTTAPELALIEAAAAAVSVGPGASGDPSMRTRKLTPDSNSCRRSAPTSAIRTRRNGSASAARRASAPPALAKRPASAKSKSAIAIDSCRLDVQRAAVAKLLSAKSTSIKQCLLHVGFDEAQASNRTMQMRVRRQVQKMVHDLEQEGKSGQPSHTATMLAQLQQTPVGAAKVETTQCTAAKNAANQDVAAQTETIYNNRPRPSAPYQEKHTQSHDGSSLVAEPCLSATQAREHPCVEIRVCLKKISSDDDISVLSSDSPMVRVANSTFPAPRIVSSNCMPNHTAQTPGVFKTNPSLPAQTTATASSSPPPPPPPPAAVAVGSKATTAPSAIVLPPEEITSGKYLLKPNPSSCTSSQDTIPTISFVADSSTGNDDSGASSGAFYGIGSPGNTTHALSAFAPAFPNLNRNEGAGLGNFNSDRHFGPDTVSPTANVRPESATDLSSGTKGGFRNRDNSEVENDSMSMDVCDNFDFGSATDLLQDLRILSAHQHNLP